jgi:hypothetical protein
MDGKRVDKVLVQKLGDDDDADEAED